jgi:hypothetical protein
VAGKAVTRLGRVRVIPAYLVKHGQGAKFEKSTTQLRLEVVVVVLAVGNGSVRRNKFHRLAAAARIQGKLFHQPLVRRALTVVLSVT